MNRFEYWKENPSALVTSIMARLCKNMDDESYLKWLYRLSMGRKLNLDNPKRLSEKLQWLKLYNHNPYYTKCVDKYEVKKIVADKIGDEYVVPLLGVWNSFDEINFDKLPNQFVLKTTHDSGSVFVCKNKATFDKEAAKNKIGFSLNNDFYKGGREWPYKNVKRRIIAEKYIDSLGHEDSVEYKITCMNGKVKFVTFCKGPAHQDLSVRTNDHFDRNFNRLNFYVYYKNSNYPYEKPKTWDQMIDISEKLSEDIPYVRIDFYNVNNHIYFGEMTFFTWSGFLKFYPDEWDEKLGSWLTLPEKNK